METIDNNILDSLINITNSFSQFSDDVDTKVGCIITKDNRIISFGFNSIPFGCEKKENRLTRPEKYSWMLHAEEFAITYAARSGIKLDGTTLFVNWFPCSRCAGLIVNSGITTIFAMEDSIVEDSKYYGDFLISKQKLIENNIEINYINYGVDRQ